MRGLDDTDREILRLLLADARRSYSDIGERVELSGPAVSDRVDSLEQRGIIRRYTVDLDRSLLREGRGVLATLTVEPARARAVYDALQESDSVEHVFRTADARIVAGATVPEGEVTDLLSSADVLDAVQSLDVRLIAASSWSPDLDTVAFAPTCAECGNTVDEEGESATLGEKRYYFCCGSCETAFVDRYRHHEEQAEG